MMNSILPPGFWSRKYSNYKDKQNGHLCKAFTVQFLPPSNVFSKVGKSELIYNQLISSVLAVMKASCYSEIGKVQKSRKEKPGVCINQPLN